MPASFHFKQCPLITRALKSEMFNVADKKI